MKNRFGWLLFLLIFLPGISCNQPPGDQNDLTGKTSDSLKFLPKEYVKIHHPEWSKNATIYEVNIRQFTQEGTFHAFESHLQRLKTLGIDIIWLMPINPIGEKNRKGKLGSYYSVKDYYAINPEFGTIEDFKSLVEKIHGMGMHVIVDWVANHSAWDNKLAIEHPEWYTKTHEGNFQPTPWYDWEDIIDFDYNQPDLRRYMTDVMKYWVKETGIDGYRCDVAGFIPVDFWEEVRTELDVIKPVFMLAEWESRDLHQRAFDMTYSWSLWDKMRDATTGKKGIGGLIEYMAHDVNTFPAAAYRMTFTDNHDKNSWEGNQYSNFGDGLEACMVLACTVNGMPLVYSGQEAGLNRSLAFFDKDSITWKAHPFYEMYKKLFALKHNNEALWNGAYGGEMVRIFNDQPNSVVSFAREKNGGKIISIINFSDKSTKVKLDSRYHAGHYKELFTGNDYELNGDDEISLLPWKYIVLVKS
jgi:cyclomaltodextrinase